MSRQDMQRDLTQAPSKAEQVKAMASWMTLLCQVLETSVVVFLRRGFGQRYFSKQAVLVIPLVLLYTLFWEGHDLRPLLVFLGLYMLCWAVARAGIIRRGIKGDVEHSYYSGTPSVLRWKLFRGRLSERRAKATVEPLLVFAFGLAFMDWNRPLGSYLLLAAGGMLMSMGIARSYERARLMDMRDSYIEQRSLAELFREGRWQ